MPKLIQCPMKADAAAVIDAFGKNEQVKKSVLDTIRRDIRAGAGKGRGPGNSSASGGDYYGDGSVRKRIYTSFL